MFFKYIRFVLIVIIWYIICYFIYIFQAEADFSGYTYSLLPQNYEVRYTDIQSDNGVTIQQLSLSSGNAFSLQAYIKNPEMPGKLPAILLLGGMLTGKKAVEYAYDVENVILISPDYPYKIRYQYDFFTILSDLVEAHDALHYQIRDNMVLLDFLRTWDRVDTSNIGIIGYSFGVPFALATAAVYPNISHLGLVYGGADLKYLIEHNLKLFNPVVDKFFADLFWLHVMDFEPLNHAGNIETLPLIIINGKDDEKIPNYSANALQEAFNFSKHVSWLASSHVHPRNKKLNIEIINILKAWYKAQGITAY
jgi:dienelactone hydrolase